MFVRCCPTHSKHPPKYRFGPCVLPIGSDSFSHDSPLRPLRRFTIRSPCRTHPSGRIRRIPNVSALSQGLHTFRLLGTHASVESWGTNPMVTSRFRFSHSFLSLSCRTEPFDSYPFDRGGEGQEGPSQYRDPTSKEVFSNIAADIGR